VLVWCCPCFFFGFFFCFYFSYCLRAFDSVLGSGACVGISMFHSSLACVGLPLYCWIHGCTIMLIGVLTGERALVVVTKTLGLIRGCVRGINWLMDQVRDRRVGSWLLEASNLKWAPPMYFVTAPPKTFKQQKTVEKRKISFFFLEWGCLACVCVGVVWNQCSREVQCAFPCSTVFRGWEIATSRTD